MKLILASGSPRRRELLHALGVYDFQVRVFPIDEGVVAGDLQGPRADLRYLERIVLSKQLAAHLGVLASQPVGPDAATAEPLAHTWILVADTTVALAGEIFGKPRNAEEARGFLARLSGQTHTVATRFSLSNLAVAPAAAVYAETIETTVAFRNLTTAQIATYAETGEGLDKAGGYAIQGGAATFVVAINGSYTNVVGLPAAQVAVALQACGFRF
jgi:septum formation protein